MTLPAPTGSDFLDALLGGGIPRGASVILQGPPGEEKEAIAWRFLKDGWDRGEAAIVVLSSMSPRRFRERLDAIGVDGKALEASGRFVIVDWFSYREESVADIQDEGSVLKVSVDLTNVGVAINWALNRVPAGVGLRAVFEVVSPALSAFNLREVFLFAQVTKAKLERRDATALFLVEKEMHDPATLSNIQQPFDGVVDIERVREGDRMVRRIGVPAMRGVSTTSSKYVPFAIQMPDAARRVQLAGVPLGTSVVGPKPETAASASVQSPSEERSRAPTDEQPAAVARVDTPTAGADEAPESQRSDLPKPRPGAGQGVKPIAPAAVPRMCPSCGTALGESDEFCYRCGVGLPRGGDPKIAALMRAFDAILATDSRNLDALFAKGAALAQMERHEEAIRALNGVTRLEPRYPGIWLLKAKVYGHLGKPKMAESCRERAIELQGKERLSEEGPRSPPPAAIGAPRTRDGPSTTLVPRRVPAGAAKPPLAPAKASTKGLTQQAVLLQAGRTAGFTNGARSRPVGLTSGRTNGLVNGRGRTNGLVNGFTSARAAIADGLTNGAGFTNGLGGARFSREVRMQRWKLYIIPFVAAVLLLNPLFLLIGPFSQGPIAIDGNFQDWEGVPTGQNASALGLNPNIDIVGFGIAMDSDRIAVYVEVRGTILAGGGADGRTMDAVRVFLDIDGSAATGYAIDGLGADRMIEVAGHGVIVLVARAWEFDANRDRKDWGGWAKSTGTPAAVSGPEFEAQIDWLGFVTGRAVSATARTQAWDGQVDATDMAIAPTVGTLAVEQEPIAPNLIQGSDVPLLRLSMTAVRMPVTFDALTVRTLGTAGPLAGTLRLVDERGSELSVGVASTADVQFTFPPQTVAVDANVTLVVAGEFVGGSGETFGVAVPSPSAIRTVRGIPSLRSLPGRSVGYIGEIPAGPRVDGGFAEWTSVTMDAAGDPGVRDNEDIDLRGHGVIGNAASVYLYADVAGRLFAGTMVPEWPAAAPVETPSPKPDSDRDTVPDDVDPLPFDFDNDGTPDLNEAGDYDGDGILDYGYPDGTDQWLNTTVPASFPSPYAGQSVSVYIGPVTRPVVLGEDILRFFLDTDNVTRTGYATAGIGADRMVEVRGKDGEVTQSGVLAFAGSNAVEWSWTPAVALTVATSDKAVELAVPFTATAVYAEMGDFWGGTDTNAPDGGRAPAQTRNFVPSLPDPDRAPDPPQTLDIGGNTKYYLRDTAHATETACGTNKVASTTQGGGAVKTVTLNTGQDACWYLDATTGTTIPAGSWESLLDVSRTDEIGAIGHKSNSGSCAASLVNCPKQQDWTGTAWGTPETELATAGAAVENVRVIWDTATDSTLFWILANAGATITVYKCTNVDTCSSETTATTQGVGTAPERHWDAAIEASSGELLLLYDNPAAVANDFCYRTRGAGSSGTWSAETCMDNTAVASTNPSFAYVTLANNPGSNRIAAGAFDTTNDDFILQVWDGTAWVNANKACSSTVTTTDGWGGLVAAEDSSDEFVAYCGDSEAFASAGSAAAANDKTSSTTFTFNPTATIEAGNVIICAGGADNTQTTDGDSDEISFSDDAANTWTKIRTFTNGQGGAAAGATVSIWYSKVSAQLTTASVITMTLTTARTAKAVSCWEFTVGGNILTIDAGVDDADDNTFESTMTLSSLANIEHLFLRAGVNEVDQTAYTASTSYTPHCTSCAASTTSGGGFASNIGARLEFRILTATTDSTQPTTSIHDRASVYVALSVNSAAECEWNSAGGWEATCATFDPDASPNNHWQNGFARSLEGTNKVMVCHDSDINDVSCWRWTGVSGTGGTRGAIQEPTADDGCGTTGVHACIGFDWNPDQSGGSDGLLVFYANTAGSLSYNTYNDATDTWGTAATFTGAGSHNWIDLRRTRSAGNTNKVFVVTSNSNFDILAYRWTGSGAPANEQSITADTVDEAYPYWGFAVAENPSIQYDVRIEIWNKATDSIVETIGLCLDATTYGDDVQCLVSGVAQTTLTNDQVVRIRVAHSSAYSSVKIDYDDADGTGDSRVTLPIPEFAEVAIPFAGGLLMALVARRIASGRRRPSHSPTRGRSTGLLAPVRRVRADAPL